MYDILILNGPNLGHLGERQPEIYGTQCMNAVPDMVATLLGERASLVRLSLEQYNGEGAIIDRFERARAEKTHGVVLNAGAYTHTSLALADCLAWIKLPVVEVHISNILARDESIRHRSMIARHTIGSVSGFGMRSYALGVAALLAYLEDRTAQQVRTA